MSDLYRLIDAHGRELAQADTINYFRSVVAELDPGRYTIQEVVADSLGHEHDIRRWGSILHLEDGTVVVNPDEGNEA